MATTTLKTFGLGLERIEALLKAVLEGREYASGEVVTVGPEEHILVTVKGKGDLSQKLKEIKEELAAKLGDYFYGQEQDTIEGVVGRLLSSKGLTLSVAESLTGGMIADLITDVSGASNYFLTGVVVYSNQSKVDLLDVPHSIIREKGAVSAEVASLMAEGIRAKSGSTFALASTGIAGPSGGTPLKPVGTVFLALASPKGTLVEGKLFSGNRRLIKLATATYALDMLRRLLLGW